MPLVDVLSTFPHIFWDTISIIQALSGLPRNIDALEPTIVLEQRDITQISHMFSPSSLSLSRRIHSLHFMFMTMLDSI